MYLYVACAQYVVSLLFAFLCLFLTALLMLFNILFMLVSLSFIFVFYFVCSVFCIVSYAVFTHVYSCIFPICVQVYQPLPPGGNPFAVNKYISYI